MKSYDETFEEPRECTGDCDNCKDPCAPIIQADRGDALCHEWLEGA